MCISESPQIDETCQHGQLSLCMSQYCVPRYHVRMPWLTELACLFLEFRIGRSTYSWPPSRVHLEDPYTYYPFADLHPNHMVSHQPAFSVQHTEILLLHLPGDLDQYAEGSWLMADTLLIFACIKLPDKPKSGALMTADRRPGVLGKGESLRGLVAVLSLYP